VEKERKRDRAKKEEYPTTTTTRDTVGVCTSYNSQLMPRIEREREREKEAGSSKSCASLLLLSSPPEKFLQLASVQRRLRFVPFPLPFSLLLGVIYSGTEEEKK
jgi:hypothetical protein